MDPTEGTMTREGSPSGPPLSSRRSSLVNDQRVTAVGLEELFA
jgi:hypothetical protein